MWITLSTTTEPAIELKNVSYSNGNTAILKNISGTFHKGKITTLIGPSGAGKTTLFKLCNGLISPNAGDIFIANKHINQFEPVELRRTVGIALQDAAMIQGTVFDNLSLPLRLREQQLDKVVASELLEMVALEKEFLHKQVNDLSGGQRQKLSIARTLVNQPDILLLDEITSSLDRVSQREIEKLIKRINDTYGTTILWITHNLEQARSIGDYTAFMMAGELVETGRSEVMLENPTTDRAKQFIKGELE